LNVHSLWLELFKCILVILHFLFHIVYCIPSFILNLFILFVCFLLCSQIDTLATTNIVPGCIFIVLETIGILRK
jgi:hypothetical protein